jgi:cytoskeletal protein CcmA (bactofilin family)
MAQIGKSLKVRGEISGSEDVTIDGEVEGTVELKDNSLTIGPNGKVHANVTAKSITILGRLEGNVKAGERVEISKTGSLEGDLVTPRIVIEDGAVFRGSIDILKPGEQSPSASSDRKGDGRSMAAPVKVPAAVADSGGAASKPGQAPSQKA